MRLSRYVYLVLLLPNLVVAQTNYVANTANSVTPGTDNTLVGRAAGSATTSGMFNAFFGSYAGQSSTGGNYNTFMGYTTGAANTVGSYNSFIGAGAGAANKTGEYNTFLGSFAGFTNTTGSANAFLGYAAGYKNTTGYSNVTLGTRSLYTNQTGTHNVAMGDSAGYNTTVSGNVMLGSKAGYTTSTGDLNTFLGNQAGYANLAGRQNTFIGAGAGVSSANANLQNATAIGYGALVSASFSLVLGNKVNVGIGTSAPGNKLEITYGSANQSGLRLTNLTSSSHASVLNQTKFLTVDAKGDVVLGSLNGSARLAADESLWQRNGSFLQSTQGEAVIIGQGVSKTPSDYNLFVSKGILTEKLKVAIKNTADWSDKVFEKGYQLKSLQEVEQHIQQTGHLPGVPSAVEVVEQGVDVARMDAKLLEKIEEMTLYMIDMKKEVNALRRENQSLRQEIKKVTPKKGN